MPIKRMEKFLLTIYTMPQTAIHVKEHKNFTPGLLKQADHS
jgi:hypothetical protein